jgi:hypothetical protein
MVGEGDPQSPPSESSQKNRRSKVARDGALRWCAPAGRRAVPGGLLPAGPPRGMARPPGFVTRACLGVHAPTCFGVSNRLKQTPY